MRKAEETEIEVGQPEEVQTGAVQLPVNFKTVGNLESGDIMLYIRQDVCREIETYSGSDLETELGGVLLGDYSEELGRKQVVITNFIRARFTDATSTTLTFTHETWDDIHKRQEKLCPEKKIVGWQHTHPGYGVFLSEYDLFIQQNFFNLPFQVAYVVDPTAGTRGFFQWKEEKVQKLPGYFVYDEPGKTVQFPEEHEAKPEKSLPEPKSDRGGGLLLTLVLCLLTLALFLSIFTGIRLAYGLKSLKEELSQTQQQSSLNYSDLQSQIEAAKAPSVPAQTLPSLPEGMQGVTIVRYIVQKGDTIGSICKRYSIDYEANRKLIQGMNGIADLNQISVGQALLLPVYDRQ